MQVIRKPPMNDKEAVQIPYYVAEGMLDRQSATIKKLWIMCIILIIFLVGSNALWVIYENSFEDYVVTQESEEGTNNFIGNDGKIINY